METAFLLTILILALIICVSCVQQIHKSKENFLNINNGGYFTVNNKDNKIKETPHKVLSINKREDLLKIINIILRKINYDLKLNFHMVNFDHITSVKKENNIDRNIIDIFIHEVHNSYNRRIILDINIDNNKRIFEVNNITISNARKEKENTLPSNSLFDQKIISNENLKKSENILGKNDTTLEFNLLDYEPKQFKSKNFTRWILPKEYINHLNKIPKNSQKVWPCRKEEHEWDENGVSITEDLNNIEDCYGNNSSYTETRLIPKFLPNIKNINHNSDYNWLFGSFKSDGRNPFMGGRGYGGPNLT